MNQEVEFIKLSPTQNMTILVKSHHFNGDYQQIALKMMAYDHVYAEQVGFIKEPKDGNADGHLQMAGNEFCGNACMSLAAFIAHQRGIEENGISHLSIEASGAEELIACQVRKVEDDYKCRIAMPLPKRIEPRVIEYENTYVHAYSVEYEDFLHIVLEVDQVNEEVKTAAEALARSLERSFPETTLIGVLLYEKVRSYLAPLIYIPKLNSMVWERGCGSGTASIGAYLAFLSKQRISAEIKQPGGGIRVFGEYENGFVRHLQIEGTVRIVAQGKAFVTV